MMPLPPAACASTAFLTHAPFTAFDVGQKSRVTMDGPELALATRSRSCLDHRDGTSPFLFRRSATALGELPPIGSRLSRSKSAPRPRDHAVVMPRSHVSVARFYDWTEDLGDCFSVSRLYREIASIPRLDSRAALRVSQPNLSGVGMGWGAPPGGGNSGSSASIVTIAGGAGAVVHHGGRGRRAGTHQIYASPGRMFLRDKKALTRGEREIIEGIYKNRGDVGCSPRDALARSEFQVRSHQEAWFAGKGGGASPAEGGSGALGRAIMKGVGLDTAGKMGTPGSEYGEGCHGNQHDTRMRNQPVSTDEDLSATIPIVRCRDRVRIGANYPPDSVKQTLPAREPAELPAGHDRAKRTLRVQTHADYWEERPSAPPSSPNRLEPSSPATPPLAHPTHAPRLATSGAQTPDKLLGMRPSLPTNAILLAEKIPAFPASDTPSRQWFSNSDLSQDTSQTVPNCDVTEHGQRHGEPLAGDRTNGTDTLSIGDTHFSLGDTSTTDSHQKVFFGSGFNTRSDMPTSETCESSASNSEEETDKKKVKVRVYLPSAGAETYEDDVSIGAYLTKERPLSHSSFKTKS